MTTTPNPRPARPARAMYDVGDCRVGDCQRPIDHKGRHGEPTRGELAARARRATREGLSPAKTPAQIAAEEVDAEMNAWTMPRPNRNPAAEITATVKTAIDTLNMGRIDAYAAGEEVGAEVDHAIRILEAAVGRIKLGIAGKPIAVPTHTSPIWKRTN